MQDTIEEKNRIKLYKTKGIHGCYDRENLLEWAEQNERADWIEDLANSSYPWMDEDGHGGCAGAQRFYRLIEDEYLDKAGLQYLKVVNYKKFWKIPVYQCRVGNVNGTFTVGGQHGQLPVRTVYTLLPYGEVDSRRNIDVLITMGLSREMIQHPNDLNYTGDYNDNLKTNTLHIGRLFGLVRWGIKTVPVLRDSIPGASFNNYMYDLTNHVNHGSNRWVGLWNQDTSKSSILFPPNSGEINPGDEAVKDFRSSDFRSTLNLSLVSIGNAKLSHEDNPVEVYAFIPKPDYIEFRDKPVYHTWTTVLPKSGIYPNIIDAVDWKIASSSIYGQTNLASMPVQTSEIELEERVGFHIKFLLWAHDQDPSVDDLSTIRDDVHVVQADKFRTITIIVGLGPLENEVDALAFLKKLTTLRDALNVFYPRIEGVVIRTALVDPTVALTKLCERVHEFDQVKELIHELNTYRGVTFEDSSEDSLDDLLDDSSDDSPPESSVVSPSEDSSSGGSDDDDESNDDFSSVELDLPEHPQPLPPDLMFEDEPIVFPETP